MDNGHGDDIIIRNATSVVSKAVFNWDLATTRFFKGVVTYPITLTKNKYYFSCNLNLKGGDIIKIGRELETKYRILDDGVYNRQGIRLYRIRRLDKEAMTVLDIENSKVKKQSVWLRTPSDQEIFELIDRI